MDIWDKGPSTILQLFLSSTARKYYVREIIEETDLAPATVVSALACLRTAKAVLWQKERISESEFRAPKVYYSLNPDVISYIRFSA